VSWLLSEKIQMEKIKLAALRDFAISHLPRAQISIPPDQYERTLHGIAALISPNALVTEFVAASLLQAVTNLMIDRAVEVEFTARQREAIERRAIEFACQLNSLTGHEIAWLTSLTECLGPELVLELGHESSFSAVALLLLARPQLQPGPTQTTALAARFLGVTEKTMHGWASKDSGPINPIKKSPSYEWRTVELIRLAQEGWRPRIRTKDSKHR
jgi:hypothetical protein